MHSLYTALLSVVVAATIGREVAADRQPLPDGTEATLVVTVNHTIKADERYSVLDLPPTSKTNPLIRNARLAPAYIRCA